MAEPTAAERRTFAKSGVAMPDGSFYIRDQADLDNAIHAVGRAQPTSNEGDIARRNAVRKHIITRADALKLSSMIPDSWNSDGSLKHSDVAEFIMHFGRKGMKWGEHVFGRDRSSGPTSNDAARAARTRATIKAHGLKAVSSEDLQHLVNRQQLEQRHGQLNSSGGDRIVREWAIQFGKQQANNLAQEAIKAGAEFITKRYGGK